MLGVGVVETVVVGVTLAVAESDAVVEPLGVGVVLTVEVAEGVGVDVGLVTHAFEPGAKVAQAPGHVQNSAPCVEKEPAGQGEQGPEARPRLEKLAAQMQRPLALAAKPCEGSQAQGTAPLETAPKGQAAQDDWPAEAE